MSVVPCDGAQCLACCLLSAQLVHQQTTPGSWGASWALDMTCTHLRPGMVQSCACKRWCTTHRQRGGQEGAGSCWPCPKDTTQPTWRRCCTTGTTSASRESPKTVLSTSSPVALQRRRFHERTPSPPASWGSSSPRVACLHIAGINSVARLLSLWHCVWLKMQSKPSDQPCSDAGAAVVDGPRVATTSAHHDIARLSPDMQRCFTRGSQPSMLRTACAHLRAVPTSSCT